jgi:hypothetical protein
MSVNPGPTDPDGPRARAARTTPVDLGAVDVRDVLPRRLTVSAGVRLTGLWRVKVFALLVRLACRVLGTDVEFRFRDSPK